MTRYHLKRKVAPKTWPITRKNPTFITRPNPKGHSMDLTLPITVVLRDILEIVETANQGKKLMHATPVLVNGKRVQTKDSSIGFMDVLTVADKSYRLLLNKNNILTFTPIAKDEEFVIQKITNKKTLAGKKIQLNCMSGFNLLVEKDSYKTGDSIVVEEGKVTQHLTLGKGASVFIIGGSHIGVIGNVSAIDVKNSTITLTSGKEHITTSIEYVFVIGKEKPIITV